MKSPQSLSSDSTGTGRGGTSLDIREVAVAYGDNIALHSPSLSVNAGEFFCLLGPSGCGKSTLLGAIAGFIPVRSGSIALDGRDVTRLAARQRQIGLVFQSYALFPHMTAAENIAYGLKVRKIDPATIALRVSELLALVKLDTKGARYPRQLSGGEQQRVAIARALAISPRILLLDEPLSNLDARLRDEMRVELKRIQSLTGVTTVFVTHDQEEAFGLGDRIAILNAGRVEQIGTPREIYEAPASPFVAGFIGRSNILSGRLESGSFHVGETPVAVDSERVAGLPDGPRHLFLRPEEILLSPPGETANRLSARVLEVVYGGPMATVRLDTEFGEMEACCLSSQSARLGVGDVVDVGWSAGAGSLVERVPQ